MVPKVQPFKFQLKLRQIEVLRQTFLKYKVLKTLKRTNL